MFFEPSKGHGLPHDPFKAIVSPRPIGWISTLSKEGTANLAPYSFFNAISSNPHLVFFSSEGAKDSATHAEETGEFVVNLASHDLAEQLNASSVDAPRGVSEFAFAGLTEAPSTLVAPPRVAECHAALECKVTEVRRPLGLDGAWAGVIVVTGEVVGVHISDAVLKDGMFDAVAAGNLARLGYRDYSAVTEVFQMTRPQWKGD
ncbi:flavin reductase family protein [Nitratireductor aquimarinus]|uniref:flavin reductase family protein n=1 Tax=Nitratireductor TaxID=245876 RepID=UPI0019D32BE3|nr:MULTISPECIES: flavin reductase family protein [Nitratireductor]MBN7778283.1 flavin reductase family protein [Nitratireductor pacificus]MBN7782605.1 flavin reductase family protein [Nitratireductor pacificus]MBN7791412.1 flavin reductase family protein [Nitratireductor aquimarinus]MBY6100491.1 flavin reductase family protein [Nitratireductor aquimarinus]MCA1261988.1 flavin reductase family protein [Nitratireductor aquimarinus]